MAAVVILGKVGTSGQTFRSQWLRTCAGDNQAIDFTSGKPGFALTAQKD
jgi:hypothetical protein